jgi:membrane protein
MFWILKLVGASHAIGGVINLVVDALPKPASGAIKEQLQSVSGAQAHGTLSLAAAGAALLAVWALTEACCATMTALNAMYGVDEGRPFLKRRLIALGLALAVSALLIGAVVVLILGTAIAGRLASLPGAGSLLHWLWLVGSWPLIIAAVTAAFALLYYFAPDVEQEFRWISTGTVAGVLMWLVFAAFFSLYINQLSSPGQKYGALAGVAVLMIYVNASSLILLLGAEINQVVEMQHPDGKQDGEKRSGSRSVVHDS